MNRIYSFCIITIVGISLVNGQKRAGYFGRSFLIGWEHSIRPLGLSKKNLDAVGVGWGKLKIEKIIGSNSTVGVSYEKNKYKVTTNNDFYKKSPRYLTSRSYATFFKVYTRNKGIAPVGNYFVLSLILNRGAVDTTKTELNKPSFGDLTMGFDFGKTFPLIGKRLLMNYSIGFNIRLTHYESEGDSKYFPSNFSESELNHSLYALNALKANIGISYVLF